ncbi:hypothetical protein [Scytonema hofmannii]|nr:hypothetical protein [Scytonema hofmannii]
MRVIPFWILDFGCVDAWIEKALLTYIERWAMPYARTVVGG